MITPSIESLCNFIRDMIVGQFQRHRGVVGVSGGIDSAVTLALTAKALGSSQTLAVLMPERESSDKSTTYARELCAALDVRYQIDDLTPALEGIACYARRDTAIRKLMPTYDPERDVFSIHLKQDLLQSRMPARYVFRVTSADGKILEAHPSTEIYREVLAASNFKQRLRTVNLYYRAELENACVVGTSNLDEEYLGFFVKIGDGTWDLCPIEGLTKTQIRELAAALGLPDAILSRPTTTDTFALEEQTQEDMFYGIPFELLDPVLRGLTGGLSNDEIAKEANLSLEQVRNLRINLERRHRSTEWNRLASLRFSQRP